MRALKCGGVFVFNLRSNNAGENFNAGVYNTQFEESLRLLEESKKIAVIERKVVNQYKNFSAGSCTSVLISVQKIAA